MCPIFRDGLDWRKDDAHILSEKKEIRGSVQDRKKKNYGKRGRPQGDDIPREIKKNH